MARILVTDNASFMRSCLKFIVENAGHEVVGMAKGGNEAVRLRANAPSNIFAHKNLYC